MKSIAKSILVISTKRSVVSAICLLLFPTPEDQFIGSLFGLLLLSKIEISSILLRLRQGDCLSFQSLWSVLGYPWISADLLVKLQDIEEDELD